MRRGLLVFILFSSVYSLQAQKMTGHNPKMMGIKMKDPIICYAAQTDKPLHVPPPEEYVRWKKGAAKMQAANIEVEFINFPADVGGVGPRACFLAAAEVWESLLTSPVTIHLRAQWTPLAEGVLGSAIYGGAYANFPGAQKLNVFYPVAIAEKITGQNLNGTNPDIFANFSSTFDWHLDPNSAPAGKYDLFTVVLHEIGHGLGFAGTWAATANGSNGQWGLQGTGVPIIYDAHVSNGTGANIIANFDSPSPALGAQLIGGDLFFTSPTGISARLYAPITYDGGSSISHLDEATFNGSPNALMTPQIGASERIMAPGVSLNILKEMGWEHTGIEHVQFPGSESVTGPYTITAVIKPSQIGYNNTSVKLHHTLDGTNYTIVTMTATGNPNEFTGNIPSTGVADEYGYFISVEDVTGKEFVNPGKFVIEKAPQEQGIFIFETGPDTEVPKISHSPKGFLLDTDTELEISATVSDNLGVESVVVQYYKNSILQGSLPLTLTEPEEDSVYTGTLDITGLNLVSGEQLQYRITATDVAVIGNPTGNKAFSPSSTGFHTVNVVGLEPTQDSYVNDFNSASDDFFGNGFSIPAVAPAGFSNGAIHSDHPYSEGNGFPNNEINLVYQLKIPIRVSDQDATIKFDEVVLVEPGDPGSVFGDEDFYDYVVVEGSIDGGVTWTPVEDGYDARDYSPWLTKYNSAIVGNNSNAVGDQTLYRNRMLNLLEEFEEGDEVVLRFRLFSDAFARGWGWAIDNLKIQIDDTPPLIQHDHVDFMTEGTNKLDLDTKVSDGGGVKTYKLEYFVNSGSVQTYDFIVENLPSGVIEFDLTGLSVLSSGDILSYRFVATDSIDLESTFPSAGYIQVTVIDPSAKLTTYSNNFNSASSDFAGNFFTVSQPAGFGNAAIHSNHDYPVGMGLDSTSNLSYVLTRPITISATNSIIQFDEIALVEGHTSGVPFGDPAFNDYVIVEGSKDEGETWIPFIDGYDAVEYSTWLSAFNNESPGTPAMYRTRSFDMTESGDFDAGDDVLIRFRLFTTEENTGWGWAIDNLFIQDAVTGVENELAQSISVYPNPAKGNITVEAKDLPASFFHIQLLGAQGKSVYTATEDVVNGKMKHTISSDLPAGVYFVKVSDGVRTTVKKIVKIN